MLSLGRVETLNCFEALLRGGYLNYVTHLKHLGNLHEEGDVGAEN